MLSIRQAAERLSVSESLVRAWCRSGALAHVRLGGPGRRGVIRIAPADLEAFLAGRRVEAPAPASVPSPAPARRRAGGDFDDYYRQVMDQVARKARR